MVIYTFGITPEWRMLARHYQDHYIFSLGNPYNPLNICCPGLLGSRGVSSKLYIYRGVGVVVQLLLHIQKP